MGINLPTTYFQFLVWSQWQRIKSGAAEEDKFSMEGCVPQETQDRWAGKVAGMKFNMLHRALPPGVTFADPESPNGE